MAKKIELSEKLEKASEKVTDAVKAAAKKAEPTVQKAVQKAEPAVKAAAKKAEPTVQKAMAKAEPTVKKAEKVIKDTSRKAATALSPEIYVQWDGKEVSYVELMERVRADYKAQHKGAIRSCKIYVKPEDNAAYYVVNKTEGKIDL